MGGETYLAVVLGLFKEPLLRLLRQPLEPLFAHTLLVHHDVQVSCRAEVGSNLGLRVRQLCHALGRRERHAHSTCASVRACVRQRDSVRRSVRQSRLCVDAELGSGAARQPNAKSRLDKLQNVTDISSTPGTHSHTQTPSKAGAGPSDPRSLPGPSGPDRLAERASEHASTTDNQPTSQPSSQPLIARPCGARAGRIPTPTRLRHVFRTPAGRPQSRSSARPRKRGRTPGTRATPTLTPHTHTHSFTHSPRPGEREGAT